MRLKKIKSCNWYHQTNRGSAQNILGSGFFVSSGGNQKLTEGVYLLNHPHGLFGEATLQVCVEGKFLDFTNDKFGDNWVKFKAKYWKGNYTKLTRDVKRAYPKADGIVTDTILVVWDPRKIKKVKKYK